MVDIKVTGLKELQKKLIEIGSVSGTKSMRASMMAATKLIQDRAKSTAPRRSGALATAIGRTFSVKNSSGSIFTGEGSGARFSVLIGPKVKNKTAVALYNLVYKRKRPRRGIIHGHFLEFGTARGVKATNWLRNALQTVAQQSVDKLAEQLKRRIEVAARKT